jgi:hypothetical protein
VVVPAHHSAHVAVIPRFGDVQLDVFRSSAESINDLARRAGKSHLTGATNTERETIVNSGSRAHSYYAAVEPQGNSLYQDRAYTLRVA